jgi:predicted double-glycine peptidase
MQIKIKSIKLLILLIVFSIIIGLLIFGRALPSFNIKKTSKKYSINSLDLSKNIYYRQTINNCAPYSVMAVINVLTQKEIDPETLSKEITWRIYKNLTYPQGVIDLLHKYRIKTNEYNLFRISDEKKVSWLKSKIDERKPVIILLEIRHIKHYFTIIGYDELGFMVYDSLQEKSKENPRKTIIDNGSYSGNRYYTNEKLIELWNAGGYKIFFRNWAVVCAL